MSEPQFELSLLKIPVSDPQRSAEFYRDTLGMRPGFVAEEYGWVQLQAGDLPLALYKPGMGGGEGQPGGGAGFHLSLAPQGFDSLADDLLERDVLVDAQVHRGDDGTTFMDVRDLDGNILKISRAAEQ